MVGLENSSAGGGRPILIFMDVVRKFSADVRAELMGVTLSHGSGTSLMAARRGMWGLSECIAEVYGRRYAAEVLFTMADSMAAGAPFDALVASIPGAGGPIVPVAGDEAAEDEPPAPPPSPPLCTAKRHPIHWGSIIVGAVVSAILSVGVGYLVRGAH